MSLPTPPVDPADRTILDFLRRRGEASISELIDLLEVTATAVRQRLNRLMSHGLIARQSTSATGRGRPMHRYSLTPVGVRSAGTNYDQLAQVLWDEVRAIDDPAVRQGLIRRVSQRLAEVYRPRIAGESLDARMAALSTAFAEQDVPFTLDTDGGLPVLTALACPYPDLAERDRSVCAMERLMISEALGESVRLSACRLDGASCCTFEASATPAGA
jgi:DeoR family suf operon transcriptional repressor